VIRTNGTAPPGKGGREEKAPVKLPVLFVLSQAQWVLCTGLFLGGSCEEISAPLHVDHRSMLTAVLSARDRLVERDLNLARRVGAHLGARLARGGDGGAGGWCGSGAGGRVGGGGGRGEWLGLEIRCAWRRGWGITKVGSGWSRRCVSSADTGHEAGRWGRRRAGLSHRASRRYLWGHTAPGPLRRASPR